MKNTKHKILRLITLTLALAIVGCAPSDFSGDSGAAVKKPAKPVKPNSNPTPGTPGTPNGGDPNPGDGLNPDDGGLVKPCDPNNVVQDPLASENLGNRQALVNFVNTICGNKLSNNFYGAGAVHSDQNTADALCRFKGYLKGMVTATGKYSTPNDNFIGTWRGPNPGAMGPFDPLSGELVVEGANTSNLLMDGLTCIGKAKAACVPKIQDIKCR